MSAPHRAARILLVNLRTLNRILLLSVVFAASYASPVSAFKLVAIHVTGSTRFTPQEILGETGLQIGQQVTEADFQKASGLLGETGMFGDVTLSLPILGRRGSNFGFSTKRQSSTGPREI